MRVFIDFWKLETEKSLLHAFNFLHKLSFENNFCFLSILGYQTSFLVSKIKKKKCFWKQKIKEKNSYQTYPKDSKNSSFFVLFNKIHPIDIYVFLVFDILFLVICPLVFVLDN